MSVLDMILNNMMVRFLPLSFGKCGVLLHCHCSQVHSCSTMWVGCQSRRFNCLFWRETRQRILGHEISPYPEVGRGRERGSWWGTRTRAVGGWTAERRAAESWRGTTDRGSQHRTPETVGDKIGSSEEDRLKMSAFEVLVEFSLVTHASDSPHMHIVFAIPLFCPWLTPSFVRVCLFVLLFSPFPRSYSCVGKEMCVTPLEPLVDHRPA